MKRNDYHIIPQCIEVLRVQSTLPISLDITLQSKISKTDYQSWSTSRGVSSFNGNANRANDTIHTVIPPDHKGDLGTTGTIYVASDLHNRPEFARYIHVDFDALQKEFQATRVDLPANGYPVYRIVAPDQNEATFSIAFWFIVEHWPATIARSLQLGLVSLPINTLLEEQKGEVILLSQQVVDSIIAEKREKFNKLI